MKIAATYAGRCFQCKQPFDKGTLIEYDTETKRVYHLECVQELGLEETDEQKAERLGFEKYPR